MATERPYPEPGMGEAVAGMEQTAEARQAEMRRAALQARHQFEGIVAENPTSSILIGFGVGFGLGLILGMSMGEPPRIPPLREESRAERLGRQMLEALENVLPESVSKRMHMS